MEIRYYKATVKDTAVLVDFRIQFLMELQGEQPPSAVKMLQIKLTDYFKLSLSDQSYVCYIAVDSQLPVAVGGMSVRQQPGNFKNPVGRIGYIMNMYTLPGYRNKGIATAIL
jgi:ribosomal protein S18 acetylase RimI-like enzyme